jgi:RNA polymerase sigma-70 factor (ECF subfamily)
VSRQDPRSDAELIDAINGGDAGAFEALYLRYRDWVVTLAHRTTGDRDAALDVMQDTFLYVLRKFPGFTLTSQFKTFLYPAVRNLAIQRRKKGKRFVGNDEALNTVPAPAPSPPEGLGAETAGGARQALAGVLTGLSEGHREVLLLRFVDGLSLQEVADAMGLPLGTVKSRLHHALNTLRNDPRTKDFFGM